MFVKSIEVLTGPELREMTQNYLLEVSSAGNRDFREFNKDSAQCSEEASNAECKVSQIN